MNWTNIKLIYLRELRDQLRDRRTMFTIAVLPLLLYPLMGSAMLQVAQFSRQHPTKIWVLGTSHLPAEPPLISKGKFHTVGDSGAQIKLTTEPGLPAGLSDPADLPERAQREIQSGKYDVVLYFPENFATELERFRERLKSRRQGDENPAPDVEVPAPRIFVNSASEKSQEAYRRVDRIMRGWREALVERNLKESAIPAAVTKPFVLDDNDVAEEVTRRAVVWSKILPFVVLIWALTGAFYPAIDLCAGEKERGTLETLLSSPAQRSEIVWGKLLTIMSFSMATSLLNLISMGVTGLFVIRQATQLEGTSMFSQLGPPPLNAIGWLVLALVPISALFSALSLAIAAFARSSKEGQYYLMPLLLITLPLMMLPILPSVELNLGTALIPVSGMMLLLRALIEGQYIEALRYAVPVVAVTGGCCLLAIRWAIDQFNNESVLFRESERWGLGLWLRQLVRDREDTPTVGEAVLCAVVLLVIRFFANFVSTVPQSAGDLAFLTVVSQVALIATPVVLMAIMLTRRPGKTLLLKMPHPLALPAAVLLAVLLHPSVVWLGEGIRHLYPISEDTLKQLEPLSRQIQDAPLWLILPLLALLPAVCEELAFRGFILSGLRHIGHKWVAIVLSSVFFGVTHGLLQQSLSACVVGVILGYIAVQSGSLLPGILFHATHNSLSLLAGKFSAELTSDPNRWGWLVAPGEELQYRWLPTVVGGVLALGILYFFRRLPFQQSAEEKLQTALDHQGAHFTAK